MSDHEPSSFTGTVPTLRSWVVPNTRFVTVTSTPEHVPFSVTCPDNLKGLRNLVFERFEWSVVERVPPSGGVGLGLPEVGLGEAVALPDGLGLGEVVLPDGLGLGEVVLPEGLGLGSGSGCSTTVTAHPAEISRLLDTAERLTGCAGVSEDLGASNVRIAM